MKAVQINFFTKARIDIDECLDLTLQSLNTYGPLHKHWAIAWSGGKDSTTLATLIVYLLKSGQLSPPESLTIFYADTRMELTPLAISAKIIIEQFKAAGIKVKEVVAELDKRFLVYILGRGVPPPNNNTLRWCTGQIKVRPMQEALKELYNLTGEKILMLTGVRQGESAIRDGRIAMSCGKNGAECGQGWYQTGLSTDICSTLAPILHWRVCLVWDWLKIYARMPQYGAWNTELLADAYGGDEAEEINARTGCVGCPLTEKDTALDYVCSLPEWSYLSPLKGLRPIYRWLREFQNRHRKNGERNKDGNLSKHPQRIGPITLKARLEALEKILTIQAQCNQAATRLGRPAVDIINAEEETRIRELIANKTFPNKWTGDEITAGKAIDTIYNDGSVQPLLFG
ncbi:MAG TPA: phosphoadenosine phosphosulfate reductase family protein [Chitinophagales bacterium]|nr:phosphoadenosine phosphosulfate reductase family protein [Chitinophagales bacterium]